MLKRLSICICMMSLSACMIDDTSRSDTLWDTPPSSNMNQIYPEGYETPTYNPESSDNMPEKKSVLVPDSYHVGMGNTPIASKDEDQQWVDNQNPNAYTIEIAKDAKASHVANLLYKTPKSERSAEIKAKNGAYVGLYGSYSTREAAEAQLKALPEDIRQNANIKAWQAVHYEVR